MDEITISRLAARHERRCPLKLPFTDQKLRELAGAIVAAHDRAAEIRASINSFDAAAAEKVTARDKEIDELEHRAGSCDELAIGHPRRFDRAGHAGAKFQP